MEVPRSKAHAKRRRHGLLNRAWGAPTLAHRAMWGSFSSSPQRGTKSNQMKELGCRFLGAAAGQVADPGVG